MSIESDLRSLERATAFLAVLSLVVTVLLSVALGEMRAELRAVRTKAETAELLGDHAISLIEHEDRTRGGEGK